MELKSAISNLTQSYKIYHHAHTQSYFNWGCAMIKTVNLDNLEINFLIVS